MVYVRFLVQQVGRRLLYWALHSLLRRLHAPDLSNNDIVANGREPVAEAPFHNRRQSPVFRPKKVPLPGYCFLLLGASQRQQQPANWSWRLRMRLLRDPWPRQPHICNMNCPKVRVERVESDMRKFDQSRSSETCQLDHE